MTTRVSGTGTVASYRYRYLSGYYILKKMFTDNKSFLLSRKSFWDYSFTSQVQAKVSYANLF
jgi:hypothetical protein